MNFYQQFSILFFLLAFISCTKAPPQTIPNSILFLGHTYASPAALDKRIENLDYRHFDHIWLGGDICAQSDHYKSTLKYINDILEVDDPQNYWALGNHDILAGNYDWIQETTGKPDFYARYHKGMTVMVLNTNLEAPACDRLAQQADMFMHLTDTISASSHLIILSHYIIWNHVKGTPNLWHRANANNPYWQFRCDDKRSRFEDGMYQRLVEVQKRGVQVIFISGDYGQKEKSFQYQTATGIWFLASGIDHSNKYMPDSLKSSAKDKVLLFDHYPAERQLHWTFLDLDSLLASQSSWLN